MKKAKVKKFYDIKKENKKLLLTIRLYCSNCLNYFGDGYEACTSSRCLFKPYFPDLKQYKSLVKTKKYQESKREVNS